MPVAKQSVVLMWFAKRLKPYIFLNENIKKKVNELALKRTPNNLCVVNGEGAGSAILAH